MICYRCLPTPISPPPHPCHPRASAGYPLPHSVCSQQPEPDASVIHWLSRLPKCLWLTWNKRHSSRKVRRQASKVLPLSPFPSDCTSYPSATMAPITAFSLSSSLRHNPSSGMSVPLTSLLLLFPPPSHLYSCVNLSSLLLNPQTPDSSRGTQRSLRLFSPLPRCGWHISH